MSASRYLPILGWTHKYSRAFLRPDVIAGITVTALIVPKNLGYAEIARVPIQNGLYAAAAGALLYAMFGTSRQISTGPSSGVAAVAGGAVVAAGIASASDAAGFVAAIALCTGLIFILVSLLKLGWIAQFISRAVIIGFLFGAAIDVIVGELPKITGTSADGSNVWQEFWSWLGSLGDIHRPTLIVGLISLIVLFGLHAMAPGLPSELIVVICGLVLASALHLDQLGVTMVGDVPRGLPSISVPSLSLLKDDGLLILAASVAIVLIGFSQTIGDAQYFAIKNGYRIDNDQESFAQGAANVGSGLVQGIPVTTSLSASSLNDHAGAKTPVASLVTGMMIILTLIFLAPVFSNLPKAVLGAVVIEAVTLGMMDIPAMRRLYRVKRSDFWIAVAAIAGVVLFGVLAGVLVGVVLSLIWLIRVATSPSIPTLARAPGTHVFRDSQSFPDDEQIPGVLAVRLEGALFFGTSESLGNRIRQLVEQSDRPIDLVVLDCQSITFIDAQGADQLQRIQSELASENIAFRLARVKPSVSEVLSVSGVSDAIGTENLNIDVNDAVEAYLLASKSSAA